jgi:hypothetical protein
VNPSAVPLPSDEGLHNTNRGFGADPRRSFRDVTQGAHPLEDHAFLGGKVNLFAFTRIGPQPIVGQEDAAAVPEEVVGKGGGEPSELGGENTVVGLPGGNVPVRQW